MTHSIPQDPSPILHQDLLLKYLVRMPEKLSVKQRAIILLHGVGSNEKDLFAKADHFPDDLLIISARAPYDMGTGRYAWFQVDFSTGKPVINEQQEEQSRNKIKLFIEEVKQKYAIDELYLGGFSQGAIMSCSIGLTSPNQVKGIIALSGRILTQIRPIVQKNAALSNLKVFVSHGIYDTTLPITYGREAKQYLESLGVQLIYHEYPVGHQITYEVLTEINHWIGNCLHN